MLPEGKFKIEMEIGEISETRAGWRKELNLISWNGYASKYDLRTWGPDRNSMGKGITLTESELRELHILIAKELARLDAKGGVR